MEDVTEVLISICIATYNHEQYIAQTIESILKQKTRYRLELIIGEDCSTDNTKKICQDYSKSDIRIIVLEDNANIGMTRNLIRMLNACQGKYIALCDGDDFWTDENKLQTQVEFLENNPSYIGSFHNVSVIENNIIIQEKRHTYTKEIFETDDFINFNPISTLSLVFKNIFKNAPPVWIENCKIGDWPLTIILAEKGPFRYFDRVMGCYRVHSKGSYHNTSKISWHKDVMIPTFDLMQKNCTSATVARKLYIRKTEEALELSRLEQDRVIYLKQLLILTLHKNDTRYSYRDLFYLFRKFRA